MDTRSKNNLSNISLTPSKMLQPTKRQNKKHNNSNDISKNNTTTNNVIDVVRINNIQNIPFAIESMYCIPKLNLLGLCRSDNSIEIWKSDTWIQILKIPGIKDLFLRRIFLFKKKEKEDENYDNVLDIIRLFTTGLNGYLIEWDLKSGQPVFSYKNLGGPIWDMKFKEKLVLIASDDGVPKCIQIKKKINPFLYKQFSSTKAKNLCITWENKSKSNNTRIFYTGYSNGQILKWNFETSQILLTLQAPNIPQNQISNNINKVPLIWSLCSINNKFLIAGDSFGRVLLYEINFGVLVKEFKTHIADILSIVSTNEIETKDDNKNISVYCSGIDSLVVNIQYNNKKNEWLLSSQFRGQSHDINSLQLVNESTLLSGGVTTDICIYKLNNGNFLQKYDKKASTNIKRNISSFEHRNHYHVTNKLNNDSIFILHKNSCYCDLYQIKVKNNQSNYIAKIEKSSNDDYNLLSSYITKNAKYIIMSYNNITVFFSFNTESYLIKKKGFVQIQSSFIFSNIDSNMFILVSQKNGKIYIINSDTFKTLKEIPLKSKDNILTCEYSEERNEIYISTLSKKTYLININNGTIKELIQPEKYYITKIKYNNNTLITVDENNLIYIIDLNANDLNEWTKNRLALNDYPSNYLKWYNKVYGIVPIKKDMVILYTDYNYIKVNFKNELPKESIIVKNKMDKYLHSDWDKLIKEYHSKIFEDEYKKSNFYQKVKNNIFTLNNENKDNISENKSFINDNFKIVSKFNSIMFMTIIDRALFVIENDWSKITKSFNGGVIGNKYGH